MVIHEKSYRTVQNEKMKNNSSIINKNHTNNSIIITNQFGVKIEGKIIDNLTSHLSIAIGDITMNIYNEMKNE